MVNKDNMINIFGIKNTIGYFNTKKLMEKR